MGGSGGDSTTDEPGPEDEQPEDHQAGPQEPAGSTCGAGKSNWAGGPKKALLRQFMGIPADMDSKSQESLSRNFKREVRRLPGLTSQRPGPSWRGKGKLKE